MGRSALKPVALDKARARRLWLRAQRLDEPAPFGAGAAATPAAIAHLGYVQIDTIHVVERCHHQILYTRIPDYRRAHLHQAQSVDKTVFEYWTHALSYVPTQDYRFFVAAMRAEARARNAWFGSVRTADTRKVLKRLRTQGPLTIRDIDDDVLTEKQHEWGSRKPSKRALQLLFYQGVVTVSRRSGMLKTYDLAARHFSWAKAPKAASERETLDYVLDRALRAQGVVSVRSACHLDPRKKAMEKVIAARARRGELVPLTIEGIAHWARPETLEWTLGNPAPLVHILSPFDPLVIQRRRLELFFGYAHLFEAYLPQEKRRYGYFTHPVLVGDEIVAVLDLKTDREKQKLLIQRWTWIARRGHKQRIEEALERFERFQLARE
ncbi:MAG TPA: crosslink repair DNA glycosylase YcaQ family protein [Burkholderiales bacterium]|nr:crosslink repair DNA glycosylase YcaQ family protein [Burkholderiales bacterium]